MSQDLLQAFAAQAKHCDDLGSHFTAELARAAARDLAAGGPTAELMAPWAGARAREIAGDAASLRLFGALHDLVLSGEAPEMAAFYPADDRSGDAAKAYEAAKPYMRVRQAQLARFMAHEPQTNEVRRSAALLGGFLLVARETRLPFRCFELGASAGLNQLWDRFAYDLGQGRRWGDLESPVRLASDWRGQAPAVDLPIQVLSRSACDRRPVRLGDPEERRKLQAFIWPDQRDRLANLRAAIDLALKEKIHVEQADAIDWAQRAAPRRGAVTVLYHSIFWQYLPQESQARLTEVIAGHGRAATREAPFAWVRLEHDPAISRSEVRVTLWPGGEERVLARSHAHGSWVDWRAA